MSAALYTLRPGPSGWTVQEAGGGHVLIVDGREQTGMSRDEAEKLVDRLNATAIDDLVTSTANDHDPPAHSPWR